MKKLSNTEADTLARFVERYHGRTPGESLADINLKRRAWLAIQRLRTNKNNTEK